MIKIQFECETVGEVQTYVTAPELKCAAQEFRERLRSKIKHGDHSPEVMAELLSIQEHFYDSVGEYL